MGSAGARIMAPLRYSMWSLPRFYNPGGPSRSAYYDASTCHRTPAIARNRVHPHQGGAPHETRSEGDHQHETAGHNHAGKPGFVESDRQRSGSDVAVVLHVDKHFLAGNSHRSTIASSIRRLAWWGTRTSTSPSVRPLACRHSPRRPTFFPRHAGKPPCHPCENGPGPTPRPRW